MAAIVFGFRFFSSFLRSTSSSLLLQKKLHTPTGFKSPPSPIAEDSDDDGMMTAAKKSEESNKRAATSSRSSPSAPGGEEPATAAASTSSSASSSATSPSFFSRIPAPFATGLKRASVAVYVAAAFFSVGTIVVALFSLPHPLALAWLALMAALVAAPVSEPSGGGLSERFARFSLAAAADHFPVRVILDDEKALQAAAAAPPPPPRPGCHAPAADAAAAAAVARFVVGYEPHSALPLGLPISMCDLSPVCPKAFLPRQVVVVDSGAAAAARAAANRNSGGSGGAKTSSSLLVGFAALRSPRPSTSLKTVGGIRVLASSAFMCVPLVRHLWYWIGNREASAASMRAILRSGKSVALCPGGERCFFSGFFLLFFLEKLLFSPLSLSYFPFLSQRQQ